MCGRFVLTTPADALANEFSAELGGLLLRPRYNIAPMTDIIVIRSVDGKRLLSLLRWGLIPSWAKDPTIASKLINARSETVTEKPSFREAVKKRRAIVPMSGFYEWKRSGSAKQPWYFRPADSSRRVADAPAATFAMAALWESWQSPEGQLVETCCLMTTSANAVMAPVHDRMPVLLDREGTERWLDASTTDPKAVSDLLVPAAPAAMKAQPVSTAVNAVRNDSPANIQEEAAAQGELLL